MPRTSRAAVRASCCSCRTSTGSASNASWRSSASIPAPIGSGSSSTTAVATPAARPAGPRVSRRSRCRPTAPNSTRRSAGSRRCAGSSPTPSSTLWMTSKPLSPKPFGPIGRTPPSSSAWSAIHGGAVPWQARTPTVLNQHESRVMAQNAYDIIRSKRYQSFDQISGMEIQEKAKLRQSALLDQELNGLKELADRGNAPTNKVLQYEREVEVLIAERGEILARIASVRQSIGEAELQITQARKTFLEQVETDLRTTQAKLFESSERLHATTAEL